MKIKISEVWNGGSNGVQQLAIIDAPDDRAGAMKAVNEWVSANRPDLSLCTSIYDHGFHAIAV